MEVGIDQLGVPAPLLYRRLVNAMIIIVMPAASSLISQMPVDIISDKGKILAGTLATFLLALLKGFEYILGDSTTTPKPTNQNEQEPK